MIILEALLLTILLITLGISTYTDCRENLIKNRVLLLAGGMSLLVDSIYYIMFGMDYLEIFFKNFILLAVIAMAFYYYNLWAAGDSKLLLVVGLDIPGRIYGLRGYSETSGVIIIVFAFAFAFGWVVLQAIYLGLRQRNLLNIQRRSVNYVRIVVSYLFMVAVIQLIDVVLQAVFYKYIGNDVILLDAVYCLIVLTLISIRDKMTTKQVGILAAGLWGGVEIAFLLNLVSIRVQLKGYLLILVFLLFLIRMLVEKYNYRSIPTEQVQAGQILSAATVMSFSVSRVCGLPQGITEDLRSKLTADEAESVRRWKSSKYGEKDVVIIRKVPFAIFISIGTILFLITEVIGL